MEGRVFGARLIGRKQEIARLDAVRARVVSGQPSTVVIGGEAGVGKSRLIAELRSLWAPAGVRWLAGGCIELGEKGLAFAPIVEALRHLIRSTGTDELDRLLGPARAELSRLLPELGVQPPPSPAELGLGPGSEQRRLFELLLGLLERLAGSGPVALVLEDLHWADRSTLDLLAFLVRNLRHGPIALVASYRTDELHRRHPLRPVLAELGRSGLVDRVELPRFTRAEVTAQLAGILGAGGSDGRNGGNAADPRVVDEIFARSDGNAFFVEELANAARGQGKGHRGPLPEGLRDLLLSRVDHLPESTQAVLRLAAVGGRRVDQDLLASLAGLPHQELSAALREAVSHAILVADPHGELLTFRHALVQEALYADVLPGERTRLHALFAEALTARAGQAAHPDDSGAAQLANHWLAAHDLPRALPALVRAGLNAESVYAYTEAQRHFEFALELWDRVPDAAARVPVGKLEVLHRAADAAARSGEVDRALALVGAALRLVDPDADPVTAGLLHERLGQFLRLAGRDGIQAMREAVRLVPADPPSPERARVLSALGAALMLEPRLREAQRVSEEAIGIARAAGDRAAEGHVRNTLGCVLVMRGHSDEGLAHLRASLRIAREIDAADHITRAANNLAHGLLEVGHLEEALEVALEGRRIARERGVERMDGAFLSTHAVKSLFLLGRWDECADLAAEALQIGTGTPFVRTCLRLYRARLSVLRGDVEAAATELERARQEHGVVRDAQDVAMFTEVAAMLALHEGRLEEGLAVTAEGIARVTRVDGFAHAYPLCAVGMELEAARAERLRGQPAATAGDRGNGDQTEGGNGDRGQHPPAVWGDPDAGTPAELDGTRHSTAGLDEVRRSAKKLADRLRSLPGPRYPSEAAHLTTVAAELSRVLGLADPEGWQSAAAAWDRAGQPYRAASARWRAAEALVAAGASPQRVEAPLRTAHVTAVRLGATPLRVELERLALRAGIRLGGLPGHAGQVAAGPAAVRAPSRFGLTRRELEVLRLLTMGKTNRQIAAALSISIKTASVHVSNIMAKLAVGSRTEAAALASRQGIALSSASG